MIQQHVIKTKHLFLISAIVGENETVPIVITSDATFGMTFFNKWKHDNGFAKYIAKIEKILFVIPVDDPAITTQLITQNLKKDKLL